MARGSHLAGEVFVDEVKEFLKKVAGRLGLAHDENAEELSQLHERIVEHEEKNPGAVRGEAEKIFEDWLERPDGPLKEVSETTQCERVSETASTRWDVRKSSIVRPQGIDDLQKLVSQAQHEGTTLRFVGSARSLSRAPEPEKEGTLVSTCDLGDAKPLEVSTLRSDVDASQLYRAQAGRVLANILEDLEKNDQALADMGSGDFQGLVGAISTSTHGSGIRYPALPGIVRSLDVVTVKEPQPGQKHGPVVKRRIEPKDGITDPSQFAKVHADDGFELVQDDEQFNSWTVSLGCLGAIESAVIDVVPTYWLHETRKVEWWSDVQAQMQSDLNEVNYYEVLVDPVARKNGQKLDHQCLVTRRNLVTDPEKQKRSGGRPLTMAIAQTFIGRWVSAIELAAAIRRPVQMVPGMLDTGVHATQVESYTDKWFEVLLLRLDINADSAELGVPMTETSSTALESSSADSTVHPKNAIAATNEILGLSRRNQQKMQERLKGHEFPYWTAFEALLRSWEEAPMHTSPISLRFVRREQAFLSMQVGHPTCMIETPMPGNDGYDERLRHKDPSEDAEATTKECGSELRLYAAYVKGRNKLFAETESALSKLGIRPHWGQTNFMTWETTLERYPSASKWKELYDVANRDGIFDGPLTEQLGISNAKTKRREEKGEL